jgi:hypothetical protein
MSATALLDANRQLAAPMSIDVSAAERMGHVVVGHLAKRHHIGVVLSHGNPGVTARVSIPAGLVAPAPTEETEPVEPARFLRAADTTTTTETPTISAAGNGRVATMRAAGLLRQRGAAGQSVWWSKEAAGEQVAQDATPSAPSPETVGVTDAGLPKRLRSTTKVVAAAPEAEAPEAAELNPEDTASILSSLYAGVRRAESEDTAPVT